MISDYNDFFLFLGALIILGGIIYLLSLRYLKNIFISEEKISKLKASGQVSTYEISFPKIANMGWQASLLSKILLAIIISGFLLNQLLIWKMDSSGILNKLLNISISITRKNDK